MTNKTFSFIILLLLFLQMTMLGALYAAIKGDNGRSTQLESPTASKQQAETDIRGTWSGTFFSKHSNVAPFTMTVVINPDSRGHLIGSLTLSSACLKRAQIEVTVTGSTVVLAGSDEDGDNITMRGSMDKAGALLKATYILNASATGKCETDDGTAELAKR